MKQLFLGESNKTFLNDYTSIESYYFPLKFPFHFVRLRLFFFYKSLRINEILRKLMIFILLKDFPMIPSSLNFFP